MCCQRRCADNILDKTINALMDMRKTMSKDEFDDYIFDAIRQLRLARPGKANTQWRLDGVEICRKAWQGAFGIGTNHLERLHKHARAGHLQSPADLRKSRGRKETASWEWKHADNYFLYCYNNPAIAETLAEDIVRDVKAFDVTLPNLPSASSVKEWNAT